MPDIPLPSAWAKRVRTSVLHVISLANFAIVAARGWAANSINARVRLAADKAQLKHEIQLLLEELRIKDARLAKIDPRHPRPTQHLPETELPGAGCPGALSAGPLHGNNVYFRSDIFRPSMNRSICPAGLYVSLSYWTLP